MSESTGANELDGRIFATPAVAGRCDLRTDTHLYRIEASSATASRPGVKDLGGWEFARELNWPIPAKLINYPASRFCDTQTPGLSPAVRGPAGLVRQLAALHGRDCRLGRGHAHLPAATFQT